MNKIFGIVFSVIIFNFFFPFAVFANGEDFIKVGILSYSGVSEIGIKGDNMRVGILEDNQFQFCGDINNIEELTIKVVSGDYKKTGEKFSSFSEAYEKAEKQNSTAVLLNSGEWSLYGKADSVSGESVRLGEKSVGVYSKGKCLMIFDGSTADFCIRSEDERTVVGGVAYRGYIQFYRKGSVFNVINFLDIDEYLYGVVSTEMPPSWHIEALKAQSVAARNYAISFKGRHSDNGFDVCNSTHCQVYGGVEKETPSVTEAVDETSGKMMYYNDEIVNAVFHSSSGGYTATSKDVWGNDVPYLKAVSDEYETEGKVWTRVFSLNELTSLLNVSGSNLGTATGVYISEIDENGRVNKLTLTATGGTKVLENENIRTFFGNSAGGSLESRNFVIGNSSSSQQKTSVSVIGNSGKANIVLKNSLIAGKADGENIINSNFNSVFVIGNSEKKKYETLSTVTTVQNVSSDEIAFSGKGWGHGVGMSQYGAKGMAESGFGYIDILKHYYTGVEIK